MYIKGFDKDLKCRGMQFEIGKTYETGASDDELLKCCTDTVIHFCDSLRDVHGYYSVDGTNRFCEVEPLGKVVKEDDKLGTNKIRIVREIVGDELNYLKGLFNGNAGLFNSGNRNSGSLNFGSLNSGSCNSGDFNSGDCNSGDWNSCNRSTGLFNTKERTITIFNKDSGMTFEEAGQMDWYTLIFKHKLRLTEWIEYTDVEKKESVIRQCIGGYLKRYSYKEACANWWSKYTDDEKRIIMTIPNFDADIFEEITGIDVHGDE